MLFSLWVDKLVVVTRHQAGSSLCQNPDSHSSLTSLKDSHSFLMPIWHEQWGLGNAAKTSKSAGSYLSNCSGNPCCVCSNMGGILSPWNTAPEENKSDWHKVIKWQKIKVIAFFRVQRNALWFPCMFIAYSAIMLNSSKMKFCVVVRALLKKKGFDLNAPNTKSPV